MTKAERIFKDTRTTCMIHITDWGYKTNPDESAIGFGRLLSGDNESICIRTINAVEKILKRKREILALDLKLGVVTAERLEKETEILNMVESTIKNSHQNIEEFNNELKNI